MNYTGSCLGSVGSTWSMLSSVRFVAGIVIVGVVLAVVVGLNIFRNPNGKQSPSDTVIRENAFRVTLPGRWAQQPSSDPTGWVYQSEDGRVQLTVSLLAWAHRLSAKEQADTLNRLVEISR